MDKETKNKLLMLALWFVPIILLLFCFYQFALKPSIWYLIVSCIASLFMGWLLKAYFE